MLLNIKEYSKKEYFWRMILVTGGTGLVGSHLLYFLLKENKKVRAIHRKSSDLNAVKTVFSYYSDEPETLFKSIDWIVADITEITSLADAFLGITQVYHAAAYISFDPKNYYKLKKINIEGTANVVNLSLANNVEKLCHVSSIATLGKTLDNSSISEETHWDPEANNNVYSITKFGAEMEVWRGTQEGLNVIIVNPGIILGEGFWNSGSGVIIKRAATKKSFYTSGSSGFVDVIDVVKAMIALMNTTIHNAQYVLVGANASYKSLQTTLAKHFQRKPPKPISKGVLSFLARLNWLSSKLFGSRRILFNSTVRSLFTESSYNTTKIKTAIDYHFIDLDKTLARIANAYSSSESKPEA